MAEGNGLLNRHTVYYRIESSNLSVSAIIFFQLFFDMCRKAIKNPNNFKIFQSNLRTYIVMNDMGSREYRLKLAEIYGDSVPVRSFFRQ